MNESQNLSKIVSAGDIVLNRPCRRREGGMPIGNGVMGTLVWTTPDSIGMQINRVDVYANNSATNSFPQRHTDYGYGCGYVDLDFSGYGSRPFQDGALKQHLNIFDGGLKIEGEGITCTLFALREYDAILVRVRDDRDTSSDRAVRIRMLRAPKVVTRSHIAVSQLHCSEDVIYLSQEFTEDAYRCSSALGVAVAGCEAQIRPLDDTQIELIVETGAKDYTVFIATGAAFDAPDKPMSAVAGQISKIKTLDPEQLSQSTASWWHDYWERGYIDVQSESGEAEIIQSHYMYFLYLMASSSWGGDYPPNFGGMLWSTEGDMRSWGVQQWWNNLSLYYRELFASNRLELLDPLFAMYFGMYDAAEMAARQQWDSKGIFIPETVWFNGLAELPEDIAKEMQDLYLFRKPWNDHSEKFMQFAHLKHPHSSRWNWKGVGEYVDGRWSFPERGPGPCGPVVHIFESNAKIAYLFWRRYEYTLERGWLENRAYPMVKGVAEFFRNYPHFGLEDDGKYHIRNVNNSEGVMAAKDAIEVITAMHGIFAVAVKAAEILDVDGELRETWTDIMHNLAPLPTSDHPDALMKNEHEEEPFWVCGLAPAMSSHDYVPVSPLLYFDLYSLERAEVDPAFMRIAQVTYRKRFPKGITPDTPIHVMWPFAILAARLGLAGDWRQAALNQIEAKFAENDFCYFEDTGRDGVLDNRMTLREGVNALGAERLGNAAFSLQLALLQDAPPGPGGEPTVRLFRAWPEGWNASFKLRGRGGFIIRAKIQDDIIGPIQVASEIGGVFRIRNPWNEVRVALTKNGTDMGLIDGDVLVIETIAGDEISLDQER